MPRWIQARAVPLASTPEFRFNHETNFTCRSITQRAACDAMTPDCSLSTRTSFRFDRLISSPALYFSAREQITTHSNQVFAANCCLATRQIREPPSMSATTMTLAVTGSTRSLVNWNPAFVVMAGRFLSRFRISSARALADNSRHGEASASRSPDRRDSETTLESARVLWSNGRAREVAEFV